MGVMVGVLFVVLGLTMVAVGEYSGPGLPEVPVRRVHEDKPSGACAIQACVTVDETKPGPEFRDIPAPRDSNIVLAYRNGAWQWVDFRALKWPKPGRIVGINEKGLPIIRVDGESK